MKTILITGANGNLGSAVTQKFLDSKYQVIATVLNEEMVSSIQPYSNLEVLAVDLSVEREAQLFFEKTISKYNYIDGALLLVGGFAMGNISVTERKAIQQQFELNFFTAYHIARLLFLHMMKNNSGRIVFIGARPALDASAGKDMLAYSLSKSLLFKFAELLNAEAKGKNVSVSVVVPSVIDTPANRKAMPDAKPENWVSPANLADLLETLCSEKGSALRETVLKVYNNA